MKTQSCLPDLTHVKKLMAVGVEDAGFPQVVRTKRWVAARDHTSESHSSNSRDMVELTWLDGWLRHPFLADGAGDDIIRDFRESFDGRYGNNTVRFPACPKRRLSAVTS